MSSGALSWLSDISLSSKLHQDPYAVKIDGFLNELVLERVMTFNNPQSLQLSSAMLPQKWQERVMDGVLVLTLSILEHVYTKAIRPWLLKNPWIFIGWECQAPLALRLNHGSFGPRPITSLVDEKNLQVGISTKDLCPPKHFGL